MSNMRTSDSSQPAPNTATHLLPAQDEGGTVCNYQELHFTFGAPSSWSMGDIIARTTNGGHYITSRMNNPDEKHVALLYFNAQDQLVWSKDITTPDERMYVTAVAPADDGGCVLVGNNVHRPHRLPGGQLRISLQRARGSLLWSKMV